MYLDFDGNTSPPKVVPCCSPGLTWFSGVCVSEICFSSCVWHENEQKLPWRNTGCTIRMGILGMMRQKLRAAGSLPELEIQWEANADLWGMCCASASRRRAVWAQSTCQAPRSPEKGSQTYRPQTFSKHTQNEQWPSHPRTLLLQKTESRALCFRKMNNL